MWLWLITKFLENENRNNSLGVNGIDNDGQTQKRIEEDMSS